MPTTPLLTLRRFSAANTTRHEEEYPENVEWNETDWALTAADSIGALCRLVREYTNDENPGAGPIFDEIADGVTALDLLCTELGGSLDQVIARRFNFKSAEDDNSARLTVRS